MGSRAAKSTIKELLPPYHASLLRDYFAPIVARRSNIYENRRAFEVLHHRILDLMEEIPEELWNDQVLVPPQFCLDDISRNFSAIMTIEHILISGRTFSSIVAELAEGHSLDRIFSIEIMKPRGRKTARKILAEFKHFTDTCMRDLEPIMEVAKREKNAEHPWFGPFDVMQWHWLLCGHGMIHFRQLKNIKNLLLGSI